MEISNLAISNLSISNLPDKRVQSNVHKDAGQTQERNKGVQ